MYQYTYYIILYYIYIYTCEFAGTLPLNNPLKHGVQSRKKSPECVRALLLTRCFAMPQNWNTPQTVLYTAVDDSIYEGPHSGSVLLAAQSSDSNYNNIGIPAVAVNIADNDCLPLAAPAHGSFLGTCSNTNGSSCTVYCNDGHAPASPVVVQCTANGTWDKPPTDLLSGCISCMQGRWKDRTGACRNCTNASCPTGMFRTPCLEQEDGQCVQCTGTLPQNAVYSGPGQPYNADACPWMCKEGYTRVLARDVCDPIPQNVVVVVKSDAGSLTTEEGTPPRGPASFLLQLSLQPTAPITVRHSRLLCMLADAHVL
jgi:hypothetical protein